MDTESKINELNEQIDSNKYKLGELFIEHVYYYPDMFEALKQFDVCLRLYLLLEDTVDKAKQIKKLETKQKK